MLELCEHSLILNQCAWCAGKEIERLRLELVLVREELKGISSMLEYEMTHTDCGAPIWKEDK